MTNREMSVTGIGHVAFYFAAGLLVLVSITWSLPRGSKTEDFGSFLQSGAAAAQGLNPYAAYGMTARFQNGDVQGYAINRNPPISVPVFQALSPFDPVIAFRTWYVLSLALYVIVVVILGRAYPGKASAPRIVWALSLAGVWSTVNQGQIYMPLVLVSTIAYLFLQRRRYVGAGVLIGALVAIKPNFLVWPALLIIGGFGITAVVALVVAALLAAAPAIIYGPQIYVQWTGTFASHPWIAFPTNGSLFGMLDRLGAPTLGAGLSVALLLALAILIWRQRPDVAHVSDLALLGSLLASPEAWTGYTLFLLPVFFRRPWHPPILLAAILLMVPETLILSWSQLSTWHYAVVAYLDNWALLLLLMTLVKEVLSGATPGNSDDQHGSVSLATVGELASQARELKPRPDFDRGVRRIS